MEQEIVFSIIMPAYNSEQVIKYALDSIQKQNYDLTKIECLVVDGGSSDNTTAVAKEYKFAKVLNNEKRLPEYAKLIGFQNAKGKYVIKLDSDESFIDMNTLSKREEAFKIFPKAKLLVANQLQYVKGYGLAGNYINICGDPFTFFMYRPKGTIIETYKDNISDKIGNIVLFDFNNSEKRPIADGGSTTFNLEYAKEHVPDFLSSVKAAASVSDSIFDSNGYCLCIEDDCIAHRSKSSVSDYINKIKFRVINNVFQNEDAGFSNRKVSKNNKKYLFILYVLSFILPLLDSIYLTFKYADIAMMLHVFYCYFTCLCITFFILKKIFIGKTEQKGY